ncbi:glycoside hydrolase family 99-like domain-containing protein, partial [Polynucleobacter sp. AM-26B4]|uniref:glycoside hydrolase family 99-like domain-containing protein n=1 Tax=Polynucleobacter sp. AM-26B4 TaxID=2689103 RepID=UPI001C0B579B
NQAISDREAQLQALSQTVTERDIRIEHLSSDIQGLNQAISDREAQLQALSQTVTERDIRIEHLSSDIQGLNQAISDRDAEIFWLKNGLKNSRDEILAILNTNSWRITKPLRFIRKKFYDEPKISIRNFLIGSVKNLWKLIPISETKKNSIKYYLKKEVYNAFSRGGDELTSSQYCEDLFPFQDDTVSRSGSEFISISNKSPLNLKPVKLICFYLPQFHEIEENNLWWGKGFTEWSNVKPAKPNFRGHYQPHIPGDLGYYSLLNTDTQKNQVELAKLYGVEGFCFYFYWFGGKRLLETPTLNFLNNKELDLPFCLCWANENWSRRWDGLDADILIEQCHSPEDDIEFIQYLSKYLIDDRYIRIDGKPLILVYRPSLLPSALDTANRWRQWCRNFGIGEIYLAYTQSFEKDDPKIFGFDAAIEFPPNNSAPPNLTSKIQPISESKFAGNVFDWNIFPKRSEKYSEPGYTLFRTVCPGWDNTARRGCNSTVFINNSPSAFKYWLENAIKHTINTKKNEDERLVFVNAWNEWAEGAHLEPDQKNGYAYLQAVRDAMEKNVTPVSHDSPKRIVIVAHDGYPHGAQFLALNIAKSLSQDFGIEVDLVCLGDGPLILEYKKWATVHNLSGEDAQGLKAKNLANKLYELGHRTAIVNTTVSGKFLETLSGAGINCISLIHELSGVIEKNKLQDCVKAITSHATKIIFPAHEVADSFQYYSRYSVDKAIIRPQGLYKRRDANRSRAKDRDQLRKDLGVAFTCKIVLGVGYADYRKGIDLFVKAGIDTAKSIEDVKWVWIGHWDQEMQIKVDELLSANKLYRDIFIFPGIQDETDIFFGGADVFALTSREDPFPSVVLEALDAGLPVVAFKDAGGFTELLKDCGELVEHGNSSAFAHVVTSLLQNPEKITGYAINGSNLIKEKFSFRHYLFDILDLAGIKFPRLSVVIPNYNYEKHLIKRIESVVNQNYPIYEILFLDDCSVDGSLCLAANLLNKSNIDYKIIKNEKNSGSAFLQWKKGCELSSGDYIWIAEADDFSDENFINTVIQPFENKEVNLCYCESKQVDDNDNIIAENYIDYVSDIDPNNWKKSYIRDGIFEIENYLAVKNTIPNVSAVIFKGQIIRDILETEIDNIKKYRVAGDWYVYTKVLSKGKIAFIADTLNSHRRHQSGLTISNFNESLLLEIMSMQKYIMEKFTVSKEKIKIAEDYVIYLKNLFKI